MTTVQLTPEDEQLVQKRLETGAFTSAEEVIHDALAVQEAESAWLEENKDQINQKISRGISQLDRGEGVDGDTARARLQRREADWLKEESR
jgi:antitoxin ParD1/3/4